MLFDCFTIFDQLELLEVRLHELAGVVDRFVIVESPVAHSGIPKPLYFAEARHRFQGFADRICHVLVNLPRDEDPVARERRQRNAIMFGLQSCRPDDVILVSDVDEIPRADAVRRSKETPGIKAFAQTLYYYWLNCRCETVWFGTRMATYRDVMSLGPDGLRCARGIEVEEGGWHFSYMGGVERIQRKLRSFSVQQLNTATVRSAGHIADAIGMGIDLFDRRDMEFRVVAIDDGYPRYIRENAERFRAWVRPGPTQRPVAEDGNLRRDGPGYG
jgi:beta-1,4-mannosyl-glycoprotein beta-1,4-N-acetylglucosaminyltransferase